nr:MFS transporter [Acidobacteriota bacterium]
MTFRPNRLQLFAMIMANNLGQMGFLLLPLWLDAAMVTHEISERGAGWLASIQLAAVALASLAVSSRVDRLPWTRFALVGVLCVTGGDLLAAFASDLSILYLSRAVCGLGSGILISLATAIAARSERPQQTYSIFAFSVAVFTLVGMLAAPLLIERFGAAGVFAGMSMLSLAFTGLLLFLPGHPEGETKTEAAEQPSGFIILAAL